MKRKSNHAGPPEAGPEFWWACDYPERPPDSFVTFEFICDACMIAMEVAAKLFANHPSDVRNHGHRITHVETIADTFERAMTWRREQGIPDPDLRMSMNRGPVRSEHADRYRPRRADHGQSYDRGPAPGGEGL